jgi:RHS repeat-associated protein
MHRTSTFSNPLNSFGSIMEGRSFEGDTSLRYRFGFNGKEMDNESETQDYGMRIYIPGLGRFMTVDPITKDYPSLTPYQFASNIPIWATDLDGLEAYFSNNGSFIKWGEVKSNDAPIIVVTGKTEVTLKVNYGQFMDRIHWAYGEGAGLAADYYAHTIDNISERDSEGTMYKHMNCGEVGSGATQKKRYFKLGTHGNNNYKFFRNNFRGKVETKKENGKTTTTYSDDFNLIENINGKNAELSKGKNGYLYTYGSEMARACVKATIEVLTGTSVDPTGGATTWAGGQASEDYVKKHAEDEVPINKVITKTRYGFKAIHFFYKEGDSRSKDNTNINTVDLTK